MEPDLHDPRQAQSEHKTATCDLLRDTSISVQPLSALAMKPDFKDPQTCRLAVDRSLSGDHQSLRSTVRELNAIVNEYKSSQAAMQAKCSEITRLPDKKSS